MTPTRYLPEPGLKHQTMIDMAKLALEYAVDCQTSLIVSRDARGMRIYMDKDNPGKITFVDPTEIAKAKYRKEKAKKEVRDQ